MERRFWMRESPAILSPSPTHRVFLPVLLWVVGFPPTGGKDVLVPLVPVAQHHLASMRLDTSKSEIKIVHTLLKITQRIR